MFEDQLDRLQKLDARIDARLDRIRALDDELEARLRDAKGTIRQSVIRAPLTAIWIVGLVASTSGFIIGAAVL